MISPNSGYRKLANLHGRHLIIYFASLHPATFQILDSTSVHTCEDTASRPLAIGEKPRVVASSSYLLSSADDQENRMMVSYSSSPSIRYDLRSYDASSNVAIYANTLNINVGAPSTPYTYHVDQRASYLVIPPQGYVVTVTPAASTSALSYYPAATATGSAPREPVVPPPHAESLHTGYQSRPIKTSIFRRLLTKLKRSFSPVWL